MVIMDLDHGLHHFLLSLATRGDLAPYYSLHVKPQKTAPCQLAYPACTASAQADTRPNQQVQIAQIRPRNANHRRALKQFETTALIPQFCSAPARVYVGKAGVGGTNPNPEGAHATRQLENGLAWSKEAE